MIQYIEQSFSKNETRHKIGLLLDNNHITQRIIIEKISNNLLYEQHLATVLLNILAAGDCFIDIGANIGYFSLIAASIIGNNGSVISFEPEIHNFKRIQANIAINEFDNITPYNMAVGDDDKKVTLFFNSDNDGGHALWDVGAHWFNEKSRMNTITQETRLTKLDTITNKLKIDTIKAIKIDTEGYEHHVLMGSIETIRKYKVPFIAAELHRMGLKQSGSREDLLRLYMQELGYNTYIYWCDEQGDVIFCKLRQNQYFNHDNANLVCDIMFSTDEHLASFGFTVMTSN